MTFSENTMAHDAVNNVTIEGVDHEASIPIVIFSESIEKLYTYIALTLFVSDTLVICCLGFIIERLSRLSR